jgi:hypothetical protein
MRVHCCTLLYAPGGSTIPTKICAGFSLDAPSLTPKWLRVWSPPERSSQKPFFFGLKRRNAGMAEKRGPIQRRGIACNFTFDVDAIQLLHDMVPSHKGYGRYLSELIRNEQIRREERDRYSHLLAQARADRSRQPAVSEEAERACG